MFNNVPVVPHVGKSFHKVLTCKMMVYPYPFKNSKNDLSIKAIFQPTYQSYISTHLVVILVTNPGDQNNYHISDSSVVHV